MVTMWNVTPDGSVVDQDGKVLVFSRERFIEDICLGDCCFICGAKPDEKPFNDEHILPDWILRRYDLFARTIALPNGNLVRYDRYKVPCCVDCNTLMGHEIEEPISRAVHAGPEAFAEFISHNGLHVIRWMGLIYLKTHLKDRKYRVHLDQREGEDKIADQYEWEYLQHLHTMVRSFYTGCQIDKEAVGSFLGVSVLGQASTEKFDYADLYLAQTMFMRLDEMGMVVVFNDAGAAMSRYWDRVQRIDGAVSELQLREIMVDFAFLNLHLKDRPIFESQSNIRDRICRLTVIRENSDLIDLDLARRGQLMEHAFKGVLPHVHHRDLTDEEFKKGIRSGRFTFLFDDNGEFIKESFVPLD